ncbi:hypothetical protein [Vibrio algarum]|uniref:Uncharacterized protein n=1 Tax=Vibrio algarum TaxID=3020714 RepID=A0ABT4YTF2_9VIBR|nr:hypothetical protein [Vibrio sp. KJ40-1]MDB1124839.1 hypothetical protein [Vibrio sp. KJ40-1]
MNALERHLATNTQLTNNVLVIRKNNDLLTDMVQREAGKPGLKRSIFNIFSLSFLITSTTWALIPQVNFFTFIVIFISSFLLLILYQIRAMYIASDHLGGNSVRLTNSRSSQRFLVMKSIQLQLVQRLKTPKAQL